MSVFDGQISQNFSVFGREGKMMYIMSEMSEL